MATYFVFHRLIRTGEEVIDVLNTKASEIAKTTTPNGARCTCLKTWSPLAYGREDYLFCLWEADNMRDVETTIESFGLLDFLTLDTMRVDEIDWAVLVLSEPIISIDKSAENNNTIWMSS